MNTIYAITADLPPNLYQIEYILKQGIYALQYRRKNINQQQALSESSLLYTLCQKYQTPFIINDNIDLCLTLNADGVHLGCHDTSLSAARTALGKNKIIGVSCYNQLTLALHAQENGASYVAFGALFSSATKPQAIHCPLTVIQQASTMINLPIVGIGGITHNNKEDAYQAGCDIVAMIDGVFSYKE